MQHVVSTQHSLLSCRKTLLSCVPYYYSLTSFEFMFADLQAHTHTTTERKIEHHNNKSEEGRKKTRKICFF
jgi:hypothetical protein